MHIVRLRGPWQLIASDFSSVREIEITVPGDWSALGEDFRGPARFIRQFGLPTNLTTERLWLAIEHVHEQAMIELNGQQLGNQTTADGPKKFEITALLQLRNVLSIDVAAASGPGSLGEVRLEIED